MRQKRVDLDRTPSALQLERDTLLRLCEAFPSPRSLAVYLLIDSGDYAGYLSLDWDPSSYLEHEKDLFRSDYLVTKFLGKSQNLPLKVDRKQVALEKFLAAEQRCSRTNENLVSVLGSSEPRIQRIVHSARGWVNKILGPVTAKTWDKISDQSGYGPGATLSVRGDAVSMDAKYGNQEVTATSATTNLLLFSDNGLRRVISSIRIVEGGRLSFVPKDAKTDRPIVTEADVNIFFQRGIGRYLRSRLLNFGCDLNNQDWNRRLAKRAYADSLATIDLASASDTVSIRTVELLVPKAWLRLLAIVRSPKTDLPSGERIELEKWSSMGNGYTFELESLIFFAIACACVEDVGGSLGDVGVFGDDIIVPQTAYNTVTQVLELLGFETNEAKSFGEGCFFESCGRDFFCGADVRPIFARRKKYGKRSAYQEHSFYIYQLANRLRSWSGAGGDAGWCDPRARDVHNWLISQLPEEHLCYVPVGYDGGIHSELDEAAPSFSRKRREWRFRELTQEPRRRAGRDTPLLFARLNGQYSADDNYTRQKGLYGHIETVRGDTGRWTLKNRAVPYWAWSGPGPWIL